MSRSRTSGVDETRQGTEPEVVSDQEQQGEEVGVGEAAVSADMSEGVESHAEELSRLRQENAEWRDKYLRMVAEFDNYRKRTLREKGELVTQAASSTLERLLPVVDDFDRALRELSREGASGGMHEGLSLVYKNLQSFLRGVGVTEIQALGAPLDIDYHEAVALIAPGDEGQRGRVVEVVRKGYLLHGHVLRHAQVVVGES